MMPAAKLMDPVIGVDIHIIQPPGPVPPLPIPHPFIGMLVDPMDFVPFVGATVLVNGMPRAIAGTAGKAIPPHIPIGGMFVKPPTSECELFMGSATVILDGDPAGFMALPVLSCQCIGMPAPPRMNPKKKTKMKSLMLPTSVVMAIPMGMPVLIGGPPTISMMGMAQKAGMAGAGSAFKRLRGAQKKSAVLAKVSARVRAAANSLMDTLGLGNERTRNVIDRAVCTVTGHPVDVATGKVFTDTVDLALPGPLPLRLERVWYSTSTHDGPFGRGWHGSYDVALALGERAAVVRLADGRSVPFALPTPDVPAWNEAERAWLRAEPRGLVLETADRLRHHFAAPAVAGASRRPWLPLLRQEDRFGNTVTLHYGARAELAGITDSAGRRLPVRCDDRGRIVEIQGPHPTEAGRLVTLLTYRYSSDGNLVEARDALSQPIAYEYDGQHRLVREVDRLGLAFHFAYDGAGPASRCVRTWGDGGVFERRLSYDLAARTTDVVDTRGGRTRHEWDARGIVTRTVDPLGAESLFEYDEAGRLVAETDPLGATTATAYDEAGRLTAVTDALGGTTTVGYDADGRLAAYTDAAGQAWTRTGDDRVATTVDPEGGEVRVERDARGLVAAVIDPLGRRTDVRHDTAGNPTHVRDRTGAVTEMAHDELGRLVRRTDAEGGTAAMERDALGRLVRLRDAAGHVRRFAYDAADNVVAATDAAGRTRRLAYAPLAPRGLLARVTDPSGSETRYGYDLEGDLAEIIDAAGRRWRFARDAAGRVHTEEDVTGRRLRYGYDAAGRLARVTDARGLTTAFERDALGRLSARRYADGEAETFAYTPAGELALTEGTGAAVRFVYDGCGRVVEQHQDGEVVTSAYDAAGNRVGRETPGARALAFTYDAESRLVGVATGPGGADVSVRITRDRLGREVERALPHGPVSQRRYSPTGRLVAHRLSSAVPGPAPLLDVSYGYDASGRVGTVTDSRLGERRHTHDADGFLASTLYPDGALETYEHDAAGNVPAAPVRLDTAAERGDGAPDGPPVAAVRQAAGWTLAYDADGSLVSKRNAHTAYRFTYNAAGRLARAERDGAEVARFAYDPLGRRVRKTTPAGEVEYLWDGDTVARERTHVRHEAATVRQYVFEGFAPVAVLAEDGESDLFVECDPVGAPRLAVDAAGALVWEADIGGYDAHRGSGPGVDLRFPGQIYDAETGLAYNRFRYYDAETRTYTQADPIGLEGGLLPHNYVHDPTAYIDPLGLNCSGDAAKLRANMVGAGRAEPAFANAAHHIVQSNSTDALSTSSRAHLAKHGIDINDADNGVFLPTSSSVRTASGATESAHSRAHSTATKQDVHDRITALNSEPAIRSELQAIRNEFMSGNIPGQ